MDTHEMDQISTCFNLYNSSGIRLLHLHLQVNLKQFQNLLQMMVEQANYLHQANLS